ncbi:hypothetical protein G6F46_014407 [Rhizopus delemar]|nr:hypothetical protein G6F46_014407 [Rhizopus delemar]
MTLYTALLIPLLVIVLPVHPTGKSTGHLPSKPLLIVATCSIVDGVVPLALTKSSGGTNISKLTYHSDKLLLLPSVSPGKHSASLLSLTLPRQPPK